MFKKCLGYSLIGMMLSNMSAGLVRFAIVGGAIQTGQVYAETVPTNTPLLDELRRKYDLNNPNRNGQKGGVYPGLEAQMNRPSADKSPELQKQIENQTPARKIDLAGKGTTKTQSQMLKDGAAIGQTIGNKVGRPALNQDGGIKAEYSRTATREFYRDETTGELKSKAVEGVQRVSNLGAEDMLSSEKDNTQYNFKADKMHGKDTELRQEGLRNHQQLKSGNTSAARGYQAIAGGAQRSLNTGINEKEGWLQPGFNALLETQKNTGEFFKSCEAVTVKKKKDIQYSSTTDFTCMDTGQANFDKCEVERKIRVPIYSPNAELKSCGPGCYEALMKVNTWKTSACRSTTGGDTQPAILDLVLNFDDKVQIADVSVVGTADDHYQISLNGATAVSGGNMNGGACNPDGSLTINSNITGQFISAVGSQTGAKSVRVKGDIRWKRQGWFDVKFKIQLTDTTGKDFVSEFIQTPAGCYDALRQIDKRNKGLVGMYDWKEIGVSYVEGGDNFSCTSPSQTPTCRAGETLFGTITKEQCLSTPVKVPPSCSVGTYDSTKQACYHPATLQSKAQPTDPDVYTCPTAGTVEGNQCKTAATITPPCASGRNLKMVKVEGVESEYCSGSPEGLTTHSWSCEGGNTFNASQCSVSLEDFKNSDGSTIKTYTDDGYKIDPVYDSDGERAEFFDVASCTVGGTDTFKPKDIPTSFCHFDEYQTLDVGTAGFSQSILDKIPAWYNGDTGNKTWKVNLKGYKCDPTEGRIMCHTNPQTGEEECTKWEHFQEMTPRCDQYIQDSQCSEISRSCPDGWREEISGRCMSEIVTFRCDRGRTTTFETSETTNVCASAIPCAGGDCMNTPDESNDKYVDAMVAANILNSTQTDAKCTDPSDPSTCRVFNGEFKYCSWETSGLGTDCCEQPKGLDILAYIQAAYNMNKLAQMAGTGAFGTTAQGAYKTVSEPITNAAGAVADWAKGAYTSATESLVGNAAGEVATEGGTTVLGATSEAISAAIAKLQNEMFKLVYEMLPQDLAKLLFTTTGEGAATQYALSEGVSNAISGVMAVYTAYTVAKLALTLLTACDDIEMDMGVRLAQRSCFKVGDSYCSKKYPIVGVCMQQRQEYCCYSSILSRIIMKESYDQLSINPMTGVPETSCQGLTAEQLGQVDFSKSSMKSALQEWVGLLADSGLMKSTADEANLTGGARTAEHSCQEVEVPVIDPVTGAQVRDEKGGVLYQKTGEKECYDVVTGGQLFNAKARDPVGTRTKEAINGAKDRVQESKDMMRERANNLDCSVYPRPPACDMGFDVREAGGN
jgi:hypothetical protein